jgi:hypothetical protein
MGRKIKTSLVFNLRELGSNPSDATDHEGGASDRRLSAREAEPALTGTTPRSRWERQERGGRCSYRFRSGKGLEKA